MTVDPLPDSSAGPFTERPTLKGLIMVEPVRTFSATQAAQPVLPGDTTPVTELGFEASYHPEMVKAVLTERADHILFRRLEYRS